MKGDALKHIGRPVPTQQAWILGALSLLPATLVLFAPKIVWIVVLWDMTLIACIVADFFLAPMPSALTVQRSLESNLSSGMSNRVRLTLQQAPDLRHPLRGEICDMVGAGPRLHGNRRAFAFQGSLSFEYSVTPLSRGNLNFGPVALRLEGPLRLCNRQVVIPLTQDARVFPNLTALRCDPLALVRANEAALRRVAHVRGEGREFESLREYCPGEDSRKIDWKATARRGKAMLRVYQPEKSQHVLVMLDCGRHMTGNVSGRRKLDYAVDAALRVARVALNCGDCVGVMAFGATVQAFLPPRKSPEQLRAITRALYHVSATPSESDISTAINHALARRTKRTLVLIMTDFLDADSSMALVKRTRILVPRHLPLIVSMRDDAVHRTAKASPSSRTQAYQRFVANRLEDASRLTMAYLRDAGAQALRVSPEDFNVATVGAYLNIKGRGAL